MKQFSQYRYLVAVLILFCAANTVAQTITSIPAGGDWESAQTWVGGTVPNQNNDVIINGTVSVTSSASACRNITISSGAILQNGGSLGWTTLHIYGNFNNNGTIRNNPTGYRFYIESRGDLINNGIWQPAGTYIPTKQLQHISQGPGKKFENPFYLKDANGYTDTNGSLVATSGLTFTDRFDLMWRSIDLAQNSLTLYAAGNVSYGTINNASDIYFNDSAYFFNITIAGTTTQLHGTVGIDAAVSFTANIVNNDVMQHSGSLGWVIPIFYGNFTNKGTVRNNPVTGYALDPDFRGDIRNEGIWKPSETHIATTQVQHISQTPGKKFEGLFFLKNGQGYTDTTGSLIATSDLTFTGKFDLMWRSIDMDSFALTLREGGNLSYGTIENVPVIYCYDNSYFFNTTVASNVTLRGSAHIDNYVNFMGDLTVNDSMYNSGGLGWVTPSVYGNLTNNGVICNNPVTGYRLFIRAFKSIANNGSWTAAGVILDGTARRTINLRGATGTVSVEGKKVIFSGDNNVPTLSMSSIGTCYVGSESSLIVEDGTTNYGWNGLGNLGRIVIPHKTVSGTTRYDFYSGGTFFTGSLPDSVIVESFGEQTPKTFGNALSRWWRIRTNPAYTPMLQYLDLYYAKSDLKDIDEGSLALFHSTDAGKTWTQIDQAKVLYHDTINHYIRIQDVPCSGDYVLAAAGTVMVPARSNVRVAVIGNPNIRVGAPNREVINLYNNSDAPSGDLLLQLEANEKIQYLKTEDEMDGTLRVYGVNDFASDSTDQTASFLIRSLGPREERDFTLYATATGTTRMKNKGQDPQLIWFIAAAAVYVAGAYLEDYITDKMVEGCFKAWLPANMSESDKALLKQTLSESLKKGAKDASIATGKQLAEDGAKKVLEHNVLGKLIWPAKLGYNILSCIENTIKGAQCYLGQTPIKDVFTHVECNGSQKEVRPVVSRDPNQKWGPPGFGTQGYIANSARMEYMIECENAPNATAAAYKIVIIDTLAPEFDENTVVFGRMSHAYTASQSGRVLKWEITGIDLPANVNPPEGESWVTYSVMPKAGLPTGTVLGNRASIVFDVNAPIITNRYINTLDYAAPVTVMRALPSHTSDTIVTVKWNSTDPSGGSGYESAMLYMAKDGGEYVAVGNQSSDSAQIIVQLEHSYSFYALAKDNVGNLEMERPIPVNIRASSGVKSFSDDADFWVRDVYPNPAKQTITIEYSLKASGPTSIQIIDGLGRTVTTASNGFRNEGIHVESIDCSILKQGTYYLRIEQSGTARTKKFVLGE